MKNLGFAGQIAWVFVIIGGINNGLYGLFGFNLLEVILGTKFMGRLAFMLVGISAGYLIYLTIKKRDSFE